MTPGTIANTTTTLANIIEPVIIEIASEVKAAPVKHLDETGLRIGGKTNWLHVVTTETLSCYRIAPQRKDIEVLANIKGVVVHDHWKPSNQLENINHVLCNAHHLRELKALEEIDQESWAKSMNFNIKHILCKLKKLLAPVCIP